MAGNASAACKIKHLKGGTLEKICSAEHKTKHKTQKDTYTEHSKDGKSYGCYATSRIKFQNGNTLHDITDVDCDGKAEAYRCAQHEKTADEGYFVNRSDDPEWFEKEVDPMYKDIKHNASQ